MTTTLEDLPEPPVPADADVRHFPRMDLDVVKVMESDTMALASGEEFKAAFRLWCKAWHHVPAGSIPDDDRIQAYMAGYGQNLKGWHKVKAVALRNFVKCSDGRLYHPEVVSAVLEALAKSNKGSANARKRWDRRSKPASHGNSTKPGTPLHGDSNANDMLRPGTEQRGSKNPPLVPQGGKGDTPATPGGQDLFGSPPAPPGSEAKVPASRAQREKDLTAEFVDQFWALYPRRVDRAAALKAWFKARAVASLEEILHGVARYAAERAGQDPSYTKHASSWLNARSWENYADTLPAPKAAPAPSAAVTDTQHATACSAASMAGLPIRERHDPLYALFIRYPGRNLEDPNAWVLEYFRTGHWPEHLGPNPDSPGCLARPSAIAAAKNSV